MEDAATAEISRSQIWQWIRHGASVDGGPTITRDLVRDILDEETARIHEEVGDEVWEAGRPDDTREVFERVALGEDFPAFLTLIAYDKVV
jgi:malate synthase